MTSASPIRRVAIVFSGGPAPAANAVISACALQFLDAGIEVVGILDGFEHLLAYDAGAGLCEGRDFLRLRIEDVTGIRSATSILLRTSHANPNHGVERREDLADPAKCTGIATVHAALASLGIDGLVTIGGDETLRAANLLRIYPDAVAGAPRFPVVHLPKTIDNDYFGIDWTFGFTSAADFAAREIRNLGADAETTNTWYILELMGRQAGWLTYAAGIAGGATRMLSVEDVKGGVCDVEACAEDLARLMVERERHGKHYGVVCVAEGLAQLIPHEGEGMVDSHGYSVLGQAHVADQLAHAVEAAYERVTGRTVHVRSKQIGYETRCAEPIAFDILLGTQLGVGAYRALVELGLDGRMVSVRDQFELVFVPFEQLVDPVTLRTMVRYISKDSDFYRLARALEFQGGETKVRMHRSCES